MMSCDSTLIPREPSGGLATHVAMVLVEVVDDGEGKGGDDDDEDDDVDRLDDDDDVDGEGQEQPLVALGLVVVGVMMGQAVGRAFEVEADLLWMG